MLTPESFTHRSNWKLADWLTFWRWEDEQRLRRKRLMEAARVLGVG